jgi:acetyltransferase-like isoleucine patch superfamily enzyme
LPRVEIGDNCIIGAGAVVTKSIDAGQKVVGVPAQKI